MASKTPLNVVVFLLLISGGFSDITFRYENHCQDPIWLSASPGIEDGDPERGPDTIEIFSMPDKWSGIIWARRKCSENASFYFSCDSGDCGSGTIDCQSPPPANPVTLLNFGINLPEVTYLVDLNHGYNVQVRITPEGGSLSDGSGPCPVVECSRDLSNVCPARLVALNKGGAFAGCYSACDGLKDPKYCCTGEFNGAACQANEFSEILKQSCGLARTYPGDNTPPIYKCNGATSYTVAFCPPN